MELGKGALGEFHMIRDLMALRAEDFGGGAHILCTIRTLPGYIPYTEHESHVSHSCTSWMQCKSSCQ